MLRKTALVAVLCLLLAPAALLAGKQQQSLPAGLEKAGVISAILRNATLMRSSATSSADYGTLLAWTDAIRTDGNGRVRVRLADSSSISVGVNSELLFAGRNSQRTALTLNYGQMRVQPSATGVVEVHTPTAVVIANGSDFAVDASLPGKVRIICLEGTTQISSNDSSAATECDAGEMVIVKSGKAPYQPQMADATTLGLWRNITDPEEQPQVQYFP